MIALVFEVIFSSILAGSILKVTRSMSAKTGVAPTRTIAPTVAKWQELLDRLRAERAPLTLKALALSGKDLLNVGVPAPKIAYILQKLLLHAVCQPKDNQKERLIKIALGKLKNL